MTTRYELVVHLDDSGDSITGSGLDGNYVNGHMFVELRAIDIATGNVLQDVFVGKHRSPNQTAPLTLLQQGNLSQAGDGFIADDSARYAKTILGSPTYDPTINIFSHKVDISQEDFNDALSRIDFLSTYSSSNLLDYTIAGGVGLSENCVDFSQDIYTSAGRSGSVASLFSETELLQSKFAGTYAAIQEKYYVGGDNLLSAETFILDAAYLAKDTWNITTKSIYDYFGNLLQGSGDSSLPPTSTTDYFSIANNAGSGAGESLDLSLTSDYLDGLAVRGNNWQINLPGSVLNTDGLSNVAPSSFLNNAANDNYVYSWELQSVGNY